MISLAPCEQSIHLATTLPLVLQRLFYSSVQLVGFLGGLTLEIRDSLTGPTEHEPRVGAGVES